MKKSLLFLGMAVASMMASAQETVYFSEDFEWLAPWVAVETDKGVTGDCVETNDPSAPAPQISTPVVDGKSALDALEEKGYTFTRTHASSKKDGECIYLQKNYLRFGKTGYQGAITFKVSGVPAGVEASLAFNWFAQRQGSGVIDPTKLVVKVKNGDDVKSFDVPEHGWAENAKLAWIDAKIALTGATINDNTEITISNSDDQIGSGKALRWHLDNVKVTATSTGVAEIAADENAPVEYYNILGVRVENPTSGLYIKRQGNKSVKVLVK